MARGQTKTVIGTLALAPVAGGLEGGVCLNTFNHLEETVYAMSADNGSALRIDGCQYVYNAAVSSFGEGSYLVQILIDGAPVGSATFGLK